MNTPAKKPREFSIINPTVYIAEVPVSLAVELNGKVDLRKSYDGDQVIHVIEHSAYLKAIEALKFYADKENWDDDFTPTIWDDGNVDLGNRARATLKDLGELDEKPE